MGAKTERMYTSSWWDRGAKSSEGGLFAPFIPLANLHAGNSWNKRWIILYIMGRCGYVHYAKVTHSLLAPCCFFLTTGGLTTKCLLNEYNRHCYNAAFPLPLRYLPCSSPSPFPSWGRLRHSIPFGLCYRPSSSLVTSCPKINKLTIAERLIRGLESKKTSLK